MPPFPSITPEQATDLYNRGFVSDDSYNQILAAITPTPTPTPTIMPQPPAPAAPAAQAPLAAPQLALSPTVAPTAPIPQGVEAEAPAPIMAAPGTLTSDKPAPAPVDPSAEGLTRSDIETPYVNQALGIQHEVEAGQRAANTESAYYQQMAANSEKDRAENEKRQLDAKAQLDKYSNDYQAAIQDVANSKIDPAQYWASKTTNQKIVAAISIALGGVGAALRKGDARNQALDLITKAIDNDIDMQKDQLQRNLQVASAKGNLYQVMRGKFDDERQATLAAQSAGLEIAKLKLQGALAGIKGDAKEAEGLQLAAGVEQKMNDKLLEAVKLKGNDINMEQVKRAAADKHDDVVFSMLEKDPKALARFIKLNTTIGYDKDGSPITKSVSGMTTDPESATKVRNGQDSFDRMMHILEQLKDLRQTHGVEAGVWNTDARNKAQELQASFTGAYKEAESLGALDNGVLRLTDALIPTDPLGSKHWWDSFGIFERAKLALGASDSVLSKIGQLQQDYTRARNKTLENRVNFFPGRGLKEISSDIKPNRVDY